VNVCKDNDKIRAIWELKTWIRTHLDCVPPVEELASNSGMSPRTFYRIFKEVAGAPPAEYIQRLRLAHGASWLAYTNVKVIEAALAAGYDSREAFTRQFRAHYGCTPIEFRERLQQHIQSVKALPSPKGLRILGVKTLPAMPLLARPHFGAPLSSISAWITLGSWAKSANALKPSSQPATVIYDDAVILPPHSYERYDAALILAESAMPDYTEMFIHYTIPSGLYAVAEFTGSLFHIEAAWDYFGLSWFLNSGLQIRENRFLTFYDSDDVPTTPLHAAKLLTKRHLWCKLCIPADNTPGDGLPII